MAGARFTSLEALIAMRRGEREALFEKYVNPFAVRSARRGGVLHDFVRGEGAYLYDQAGQRFVDFDAGNGVFGLGRNHPRARAVLAELLQRDPSNMVSRHVPLLAGLLAEALVQCTPAGLDKVLFTTTGSETTEAALKFARRLTGRPRLLYLEGDFHGVTYGALSVTDLAKVSEGLGPLLPGCARINAHDLDGLARELARGDVAALIVEPVQGVDVQAPAAEFLTGAQRLCRRHGSVFIVDEVFTGFGRTGKLFACEHLGLEPDLLVLSKSLSAGYVPVGALLMRGSLHDRVFDQPGVFIHGSTFEYNDFAMAAGLATLHVLEEESLVTQGARMGALLREGLRNLQKRYDMIADVRGAGLLIGIEFRAPGPFTRRLSGRVLEKRGLLARMVMMELLAKHQLLTTTVINNNVLRLTPPLVLQEADVRHFLSALEAVLQDAYRFPDGITRFVLGQLLKLARGH